MLKIPTQMTSQPSAHSPRFFLQRQRATLSKRLRRTEAEASLAFFSKKAAPAADIEQAAKAADSKSAEKEKADKEADKQKQEQLLKEAYTHNLTLTSVGKDGWPHPKEAPSIDELKQVFTDMKSASTSEHDEKENIKRGVSESWDDLQEHFAEQLNVRSAKRKGMLEKAVRQPDMKEHNQYEDFTSIVMSLPTEQVKHFLDTAKETAAQNDKANKLNYEYVDGLEHLAGAASDAYDKAAVAHQVGYDQYRGQLEEGRMDSNKPTRMVFPFGSNIVFKPNSAELYDFSRRAITESLIPEVTVAMEKYAGRHFTICIHAATNLQRGDVPDRRDLKQIEAAEEQVLKGGGSPDSLKDRALDQLRVAKEQYDSQEMKRLLDGRFEKMKELIAGPLQSAVKPTVRFWEHHLSNGKDEQTTKDVLKDDITVAIPNPSKDTRHFRETTNDALMPSAAIIIIAEEKGTGQKAKGSLSNTEEKAECKMSTFDKWQATRHYRHDFDPHALPISETALFFNGLPSSRDYKSNSDKSPITGEDRLAGDQVSKLVAYGDTRLEPLQAVLKEATEEKDKLLRAFEKKDTLVKAAGIKNN